MRIIRPKKHGGPDVLVVSEEPTPEPGPREVRVKVEAVGVNAVDGVRRLGKAAREETGPFTLGFEGAGVVDAVADDVTDIKVGQRVCWSFAPTGCYATHTMLRVRHVIPVPDYIDSKTAAAAIYFGLFAHATTVDVAPLARGKTVLIFGVSNGLGHALLQAAKIAGAEVWGVANEMGKNNQLFATRIDHVLTSKDPVVADVRRMTADRGVDVSIDALGGNVRPCAGATTRRGLVAMCGQVGPTRIEMGFLAQRGSLFVTRPALRDYTPTREALLERARVLWEWIREKKFVMPVEQSFPLAAARLAHERLAKGFQGKMLLLP
ncbi:MAG TPA: zinc-binding dehydrogenase [Byssovorax sp.]|jgi:NADPH2:quinone reductase